MGPVPAEPEGEGRLQALVLSETGAALVRYSPAAVSGSSTLPTYRRPPKGTVRTRHLYLANTGPSLQVPLEEVARALAAFGTVAMVCCPDSSRPYVYATFVDEAAAERACAELDGTHISARRVTVRFADVEPVASLATPPSPPCPIFTDAADTEIPGLALLVDFVTAEEEERVLAGICGRADLWVRLAKRRVQHYGFEFSYATRTVDRAPLAEGMPEWAAAVRARAEQTVGGPLDQLTVNEYACGVGLAPHIDTHSAFKGPILALSLAGHTVMEFRRRDIHRALLLPPRSLLVMDGEARYAWAHYIPHRKSDLLPGAAVATQRPPLRVSLTLRKVKDDGPCSCTYPEECDSRQPGMLAALQRAGAGAQARADIGGAGRKGRSGDGAGDSSGRRGGHRDEGKVTTAPPPPKRQREAQKWPAAANPRSTPPIEREYVQAMYDAIAPHFSVTRFSRWPKVVDFLKTMEPHALVADCGCGNGKYLTAVSHLQMLGSDASVQLLNLCRSQGHDVVLADTLQLPYRSASCDGAISIAVLHHLSSWARRRAAVEEMLRVLRPGGQLLVTVWALEQENPSKTLCKWSPINAPAMEHAMRPECSRIMAGTQLLAFDAGGSTIASTDVEDEAGKLSGGDFFVPWHLPLHRRDAVLPLQSFAPQVPTHGVEDEEKRSIKYNRFYHLFVEGELHQLISEVEGAELVDLYYDHSNWGAVIRKMPTSA